MTPSARILLVIDEPLLRQTVADYLSDASGHAVALAQGADWALEHSAGHDLIIIDDALVDGGGARLCRLLRDRGVTTALLLLAAGSMAANAADAVVAKPLRLGLLAGRVSEMLANRPEPAGVRFGPWRFEAGRKVLLGTGGQVVRLTDKEAAILCRLGQAGGEVVGRDVLLADIWGYSAQITTHTLETHIYRLRRKVESDPEAAGLLCSQDGGYRLGR